MTPKEIGLLLTLASGFDRRQVDEVSVAAWYSALSETDYTQARNAVVNHFKTSTDYLTVRHVLAFTEVGSRSTKELVAADVRSARARGLVGREWPETTPVPEDVRADLQRLRDADRNYAIAHPIDPTHWDGNQVYGEVGRTA